MTKETELLKWMQLKKVFATHDVMKQGLEMFYTRARRTMTDFISDGLVRKLSGFEKKHRGYTCKDGVYEINEKEVEIYFQPDLFLK